MITGEEIVISDAFQVLNIERRDDITDHCRKAIIKYKKTLERNHGGSEPWIEDNNSGYNVELQFRNLGWEPRRGVSDERKGLNDYSFEHAWHGWWNPQEERRRRR